MDGNYLSDIKLTPDESKILASRYSWGRTKLSAYDSKTLELLETIAIRGDFAGEIRFSKDGRRAVIGSAGNPASIINGQVTVIDLESFEVLFQKNISLADNLASSGNNEFFVSSSSSDLFERHGLDVFVLGKSGQLSRTKTFFLGINHFTETREKPQNDQIRAIFFKPSQTAYVRH